MNQSRREERSLCADLLKIRWRNSAGVLRNEYATLEDISASGACLQIEEPIETETPLTLYYPAGKFQGRVKYCTLQGNVYIVGLEFDPGYRWSRKQYKPSHLLQFRLASVRQRK